MIKYEIKGGMLPVVICYPEAGQALKTEKGAMSWMSPNMEMSTNAKGNFLGRALSGESIFMNEYRAVGSTGTIAFSSSFPGSIIPYEVSPGNEIVIQKGGFLAMEEGLNLSIHFQKKLGAGFFGGEGFIMQKVSGNGLVFMEIDGSCIEYELAAGQQLIVDTGYLAAFTGNCSIDVKAVKGFKNIMFGGEGLFNTVITGPGKVYLQSMPVPGVAGAIRPYIATK